MFSAPFLPALRELASAYQAFEACSSAHIRTLKLTTVQFDVIATLGNTPGMAFKELGEKRLITKGTLTGVVDRLADMRLVRRVASSRDGRSQVVQLSEEGETMFARVFPPHLAHLERAFSAADDLDKMRPSLRRHQEAFKAARSEMEEAS